MATHHEILTKHKLDKLINHNRNKWDINEDHVIINGAKVRDIKIGQKEVVEELKYIKELYENLKCYAKIEIKQNNFLDTYERNGIRIFIEMKHDIMEINPTDTQFNAINKPKNVTLDKNVVPHNTDGKLRAKWRNLMFRLRTPSGNLIYNRKQVTKLVVHELAHTMANHVTWRSDDHGKDFQIYQKLLTRWCIILGLLDDYVFF